MINRYHLQREFQMVSENKSVKREWNFKKKKVCEMHLGGRKVGGCNCVFMRMRYSRPAQSVPFVSLHYCTIHCIHTLQTAHYKLHTARRALQYCNVGSDCPLCVQPSLSTCMHCRLQIAQMWSRYRAPYLFLSLSALVITLFSTILTFALRWTVQCRFIALQWVLHSLHSTVLILSTNSLYISKIGKMDA